MGAFVPPLFGFLDAALTDFVKRFQNNELHADKIAPRVPVPYQSGKYWIFGRENQNILQQTLRATGTGAQHIRRSISTGSLFAASHALAVELPDEDIKNYQAGDLRQDATQDLISKILLDKEDRLATMLSDTAQVTNNTTLAGTDQWSDYQNSAPRADVEAAKAVIRQAGVRPNFMIVGDAVFTKLRTHPSLIDAFKYTVPGAVLTERELAQIFGVDNFYVGSAVKLDKAGTSSFVWGKNAVIGYVSPGAGRMDVSGAKSFIWGSAPGTIDGFSTIVGRNPDITAKADVIGVDFYYDQQITAVETLYLLKNAVA
jgi:hypothetical protein